MKYLPFCSLTEVWLLKLEIFPIESNSECTGVSEMFLYTKNEVVLVVKDCTKVMTGRESVRGRSLGQRKGNSGAYFKGCYCNLTGPGHWHFKKIVKTFK